MSNLSAIGFAFSSETDFQRGVGAALDHAVHPSELGTLATRYLWFRDSSGAALAARLDAENAIDCITPFFVAPGGGTRWRVGTSGPHLDRECLHCSGADCDVLHPTSGTMCTRTALQFLFFEPYQRWLEQERTFDAVIVGFASSLALCATAEGFERAQAARFGEAEPDTATKPGKPMRLADEAFLPHGMFDNDGHLGGRACALISGSVKSVKVARNELTGSEFVHTLIHTLGGAIDIVAPAEGINIPEHPTLALADCWLVGRPVEAPPSARANLSHAPSTERL